MLRLSSMALTVNMVNESREIAPGVAMRRNACHGSQTVRSLHGQVYNASFST